MRKGILLVVMAVLGMSCSNTSKLEVSNRSPQQAFTAEEAAINPEIEENRAFEQSFQSVMKASGQDAKELRENRNRNANEYIRRQMGFFYLAQGLLLAFDNELEVLYRQKLQDQSVSLDYSKLEELAFKLRVAREFAERNLHELKYIVERLLQESNSNGPLKQASYDILGTMNVFFNRAWSAGDQWGVISLAREIKIVYDAFLETHPDVKLKKNPEFYKYTKMNQSEIEVAVAVNRRKNEIRKSEYVDYKLQKEWDDHQAQRAAEEAAISPDRRPNSDTLFPDSKGPGYISGNMFPSGTWALTFDDGPHPVHTQGMIDALNSANYRGTFFWLSKNLKAYPSFSEKVSRQGSNRASHSYTHANLPKLGTSGLKYEIDEAANAFKEVVGAAPTFFRCPYGACGPHGSAIRQRIANLGMMHVFWNVDSLDWQDKNPQTVYERTRKQMEVKGRGIVLFHDIHSQSVAATKLLVKWMKEKNLNVLTMEEVMKSETGNSFPSP